MNINFKSIFPENTKIVFVGTVVSPDVAERDRRISVAGNNFQIKFIRALTPNNLISIVPVFLAENDMIGNLGRTELYLATKVPGPKFIKVSLKIFGDFLKYALYLLGKDKLTAVFYNLDYYNVFLALLTRIFGHKAFVIAADYVNPPVNIYHCFLLWVYKRMSGIVSLRKNQALNKNALIIPAILDGAMDCVRTTLKEKSVLYSGSIGETTGLNIVLRTAVVCPDVKFYITGRPFHISEINLIKQVMEANSRGADIEYLGMLSFEEYRDIFEKTSIAVSMRNPSDLDHNNNFPSKIAEYMSAGKIVISSMEYSELPEHTYVRVEYTAAALAGKISEIFENSSEWINFVINARNFINSKYSIQSAKHQIIGFLNNA